MNSFLAKKFLEYKLKAKDEHSLHSPFAFDFYCNVIDVDYSYYVFNALKKIREQLKNDNTLIQFEELGAGSKHFKESKRIVKDIARYGITAEKYSRLLFRIAESRQAKHIVELGTSLGLNSMYLAAPSEKSEVITLEGCRDLCACAKKLHKQNSFHKRIEIVEGNFDQTLEKVLNKIPQLDLFFIDGNHQLEPTLKYFEMGLSKIHNDSIFVLDDIYWSEGMEQAWKKVKDHPQVTMTMDLFQFGLVFFRKEHHIKEHFILKF